MNISPIDNRYMNICKPLSNYTSDFGLNKLRCEVEIEYFILIIETVGKLNNNNYFYLRNIYKNFSLQDLETIRTLEKETNHDIKALEYFIKNKLKNTIYDKYREYVHFALTSQDINSVTNTLTLKHSINNTILKELTNILTLLNNLAKNWSECFMISKTHGQSATTTSMGKELYVYYERLNKQINKLKTIEYSTKFGGAVGNLNAHIFCFPYIKWDKLFDIFLLNTFDLERNKYTTQIDHYDNLCEVFDILKRINTILIDLNQDIWLYISYNYFKLKVNTNETGSSTMPHKVNPINFENSEGNIYLANSLLSMFSSKLPISRLQRDLTDSTITRNVGVALSHCLISYNSLIKGLKKLEINKEVIQKDLNANWCVLMEPLQCIMKTQFINDSYEIIKNMCRNKNISQDDYKEIVNEMRLSDEIKERLLKLTPSNYTGNLTDYLG